MKVTGSRKRGTGPSKPVRPGQVPIEREEIAALASRRWQEAGSPPGRDLDFWLAAESELKLQRAGVDQTVRGEARPAPGTP